MVNSSFCPLRKIYKVVLKKLGNNEFKVKEYDDKNCKKCDRNCDRVKFEILGITGNLRLF